MEFAYDPAWVASKERRPLSLSLPMNLDGLPIRGEKVGYFFDNLLPDSDAIRQRIRNRFRTSTGDAFDLLTAVGKDCAGALQLLPEGQSPTGIYQINVTALDASQVEQELRKAVSPTPLFRDDDDDFRISIAGAQEKTAFTWHDGRWCKPHMATPTTHIFKLPLGLVGGRQMDMTLSLENEWLCCQFVAEFGIPVAPSTVERFGAQKTLVVERFDRRLDPSQKYWLRLPQEDFCQALGLPSSQKYETDGGPGVPEIAQVLHGSETRNEDLATLLRTQLVFWMLAAVDGHAKNFSIHLLANGRYRLTPLYDIISAWPITGSKQNQIHSSKLTLAMALRGKRKHYRVEAVARRHFNRTARLCGFGKDMESMIADVIEKTPSAIERVRARLPPDFPLRLFDQIASRVARAARQLDAMPPE